MTPEKLAEMQQRQLAVLRFNYIFRAAWTSIAQERGYMVDMFLGTSSHGTIAIRSYLSANGV